jgi:hypothetical protein
MWRVDRLKMPDLLAGCMGQTGKDERLSPVQRQQQADSFAHQAVEAFRDAPGKTNITIKQILDDPELARLRENSALQTFLTEVAAKRGDTPKRND